MSANSGRLFNTLSCEDDEEQRSPLGLTRSGRPVWPIRGAEDDDDADDDDDDDSDDDDDDDTDSGGDKSKKSKKAKDDSKADDDDEDDDDAEERISRMRKRMRAADRRASEAERKLREAEAKKDGEGDQSLKPQLEEATKQVETLQGENSTLRLQNAFLLNNKFSWHDPEDVMALVLKDDDVEIDEESGEVHGMEAALKRIARKKPWMVKPDKATTKQDDDDEDDDEDDEDDDDEKPEARRRTNRSGGPQNRRRTKGKVERQKMLQTYPALNRR